MKHRTSVLVIVAFALLSAMTANAQSPDMVADLAARINRERTSRSLVPYALNSDLSLAAQAHASDIARTGNLSHIGSDGSTVFQRVARTGYGSYSWGRRLGENWAWYHSIANAMAKWMASLPHRENILHALYREFGIGIAPHPVGGYVFVIVFGAQPNVLPIFVNDGAGSTPTPSVTIVLSDEEVAPWGDTPATIGHPTEIQISNDPGFPGTKWEPYSTRRSWTLASGRGVRTVYVKLRDARGRTVTSSDSIAVGGAAAMDAAGASATANPTASRTPTRRPTVTRTRTPRPTVTRTLTPRPTARPSSTASRTPVPSPTVTQSPVPTPTEVLTLPYSAAAETPMVDASTPEPAILSISSLPPEPTELAAALTTPPDTLDQSTDQAAYVAATLWQEITESVSGFAATASDGTGGFAVAVFAVAAVIGIIAANGFRSGRVRAAKMQMGMKRTKK